MDSTVPNSEENPGGLLSKYRSSVLVSHIIVFCASMAAFLEQPLVGKTLLPYAGGGASAWVTTLMFFQVFLVAGYFVGYKLSRLSGKFSLLLSVGIVAGPLLVIPAFILSSPGSVVGILSGMFLLIPGYVVLTSTLILMSNRMIRVFPEKNPYRLAASSNAGSFVGLFVGLLFTEFVPLNISRWLWWALIIFVVVSLIILLFPLNPDSTVERVVDSSKNLGKRAIFQWGVLAALGSAFLVSYSGWFNENVVVMPLLWVLPLAIYLALFSFVFSGVIHTVGFDEFIRKNWAWIVISGFAILVGSTFISNILFGIVLGMLFYSVPVWFILYKLESLKPNENFLSMFWIVVAVGGAVGGIFAGIVFPLLFDGFWEIYPLFIAPFLFLAFPVRIVGGRLAGVLAGVVFGLIFFFMVVQTPSLGISTIWAALIVLGAAAASVFVLRLVNLKIAFVAFLLYSFVGTFGLGFLNGNNENTVVNQGRSLYGTWVVYDNSRLEERLLSHNGIVHGFQSSNPQLRKEPTSYYGRGTGVGDAFQLIYNNKDPLNTEVGNLKVGVVGLGVGVLAAWQDDSSQQEWTFFEIDPEMANVASSFFSFMTGNENVVVGDARLSLQDVPDGSLDVLVLDAYLGDSVPTHLMTVEAYDSFSQKLKKDGVILSHVSNIYLNVDRVVVGSAMKAGMVSLIKNNPSIEATEKLPRRNASSWILSTKNENVIQAAQENGWRVVSDGSLDPVIWTDELTPFLRIIKW